MAYNYSQLWEAFISGEDWSYDPIGENEDWETRTQQFYSEIVGPAFGQEDSFGKEFKDYIASFELSEMERAEETFRMSIGDPYGGTEAGDPFSWEKISRYDPNNAQDLLESELYEYGEQLGGETGAEYGTGMAKELETYTTGLGSQREGLSYAKLEGGQGLASGTSGAVLRSGEGISQAEDVLIEAYKKSKSLGTEYTEGKEGIEVDLRGNLDEALTTYLAAIDSEKESWYSDIMGDVIRKTEITGITTDVEVEAGFEAFSGGREEWQCGYGLKWAGTDNDGNPICIPLEEGETTEEFSEGYEDIDYEFREGGACGIGQIWVVDNSPEGGRCQVPEGLDLTYGKYGEYCATSDLETCGDGSQACPGECEEVDECGVENGPGPQYLCLGGTMECNESDCPSTSTLDDGEEYVNCTAEYGDAWEWDALLQQCVDMGTSGMQIGTDHCAQPYNSCPTGECCCKNGACHANCCGRTVGDYKPFWDLDTKDIMDKCPNGEAKLPDGTCPSGPKGGF